MNRRSFVRWLGLAPVAASAVVAATPNPKQASGFIEVGPRRAGFSLQLLPDGGSQFVVNPGEFSITANGGAAYPFALDGGTLPVSHSWPRG